MTCRPTVSVFAAVLVLPAVVAGCGMHVTHHTLTFRDPAAVSVLLHPPGPKHGVLALPAELRGTGVTIPYSDQTDTDPPWSLRARRDDLDAISLEFRSGESLLSEVVLIDGAGAFDGDAVMDLGIYSTGDRTVVRDPDGLVWARLGYVPEAASSSRGGRAEWRRIAHHMELAGPGAISIVTAASNVESIRRRTEVPWEVSAFFMGIGVALVAASVPMIVESLSGDMDLVDSTFSLGVGVLSAVGGLFSIGSATLGLISGDSDESLDPASLPVEPPRARVP